MGLGPIFKLKIEVTNAGTGNLQNFPFCVGYNPEIYWCDRPSQTVPLLLPNVTLTYEVTLKCIHLEGKADNVRVIFVSPNSSVPLVSGIINMPLSELNED